MRLRLATAQLQTKDSNCYSPLRSEIQILLGMLRLLKVSVWQEVSVVLLWVTCVLCALGLAFKMLLFCIPFLLALKHVTIKC